MPSPGKVTANNEVKSVLALKIVGQWLSLLIALAYIDLVRGSENVAFHKTIYCEITKIFGINKNFPAIYNPSIFKTSS